MEALPGLWSLSPLAALVGMLTFSFIAFARGWVIPQSSHEREMASANLRGDEWKEAAMAGQKLIGEQSAQISTLVEATKTPAEFFGTVMREGGMNRVEEASSTDS